MKPAQLYASPNALVRHYRDFAVEGRVMLTGHSHQAWPDCARAGMEQSWRDAAELVDKKWQRAFACAEQVAGGFSRLLDDDGDGTVTLGHNTHELVVRWLSALPLRRRPRLVTTDGEFHSIRRQLDRLAEEGLEIVKVSADDPRTLAERLAREVDARTAAVMVSAVLFRSGRIVPELGGLLAACQAGGAELLVDAYHALNVLPFSLADLGLANAYVVGGGYKYCQLGEGNCFLRAPADCQLRPAITGWFSEFGTLSQAAEPGRVLYGEGAARFAGATYDPVSNYRAARVFEFFTEQGLTAELLREVSQHQIGLLARGFDALDLDPSIVDRDGEADLAEIGGFLVLRSAMAERIRDGLAAHGVDSDVRGRALRLGPAPYLSDAQLGDAVAILGQVVTGL